MAIEVIERSKALTAEDIIRRYNLEALKGDRVKINTLHSNMKRQETIIKDFIAFITPYKKNNLLTTWFGDGTPTLENFPFSDFEDKDSKVGDLYYDRQTGDVYQLEKNEDYEWKLIEDYNLAKSLAIANSEPDTDDNFRNIYFDEPFTPYEIGDIWLNGNNIFRCRSARADEAYDLVDWTLQENYTDSLVLRDTRAILDEFKMTVEKDFVTKVQLETTVDSITASVEAITTEIVTTATEKYEFYDTQLSEINIEIGKITSEVSEVKTNFGEEIKNVRSEITQTADSINSTVTDFMGKTETSITQLTDKINSKVSSEDYNSFVEQTASSLSSKVNSSDYNTFVQQTNSSISSMVSKSDLNSYMRQNYDEFLYGFNNDSYNIQLSTSGITLYDGSISSYYKVLELDNDGLNVYNRGTLVGCIHSNVYVNDNSQKSLSFDLDSGGSFMGWFVDKGAGSYYAMLYYTKAGKFGQSKEGIYLGTNLYTAGHSVNSVNLTQARANDYETVDNKSIDVITDISVDEDGNLTWDKASINVRSGLITSAPSSAKDIVESEV